MAISIRRSARLPFSRPPSRTLGPALLAGVLVLSGCSGPPKLEPGPVPSTTAAAFPDDTVAFGVCPSGQSGDARSLEEKLDAVSAWLTVEKWQNMEISLGLASGARGDFTGKVNGEGPSVSHTLFMSEDTFWTVQTAQVHDATVWLGESQGEVLLAVTVPNEGGPVLSGICE